MPCMYPIQVRFVIDNGGGAIVATYTPSNDSLCDGNWHTVMASKSGLTVSLAVDDSPSVDVTISNVMYLSVDTSSPLFIAGVPGELQFVQRDLAPTWLPTAITNPLFPFTFLTNLYIHCFDSSLLFVDAVALQPTITNDHLWGCFGMIQVTEAGEFVTLSFAQSSNFMNMGLYTCTLTMEMQPV